MSLAILNEKAKKLPKTPGVYIMKNSIGKIIYIGKAKNLKSRVSSYFQSQDKLAYKVKKMVGEVATFDVLLVKTEVEALLLERTLIKSNSPQFNILLRDDKEYPYIRVDLSEPWPRIRKVRRRKDDKATYLGPFAKVGILNTTLQSMYKIFPLVRCKEHEFNNAKRPCNYYHIKMCLGPCVLKVDRDAYLEIVKNAIRFLKGENKEVMKEIENQMFTYAKDENFEQAAILRDQLQALKDISQKQQIVISQVEEADFISYSENESNICFHILSVKEGRIVAHYNYHNEFALGDTEEALTAFLLQYYEHRRPPGEIYLPKDFEDLGLIEQVFAQDGFSSKFLVPKIGDKKALIETATANAKFRLDETYSATVNSQLAIAHLQKLLNLENPPNRMECMDISNMGGTAIVASVVSFFKGKPDKQSYRKYNLGLEEVGPDDFGSIYQITKRRLYRAIEEQEFPDLLIIDGGKGQLSAAKRAQEELNLTVPPIVSIAKARSQKTSDVNFLSRTDERIFIDPERNPIPLRMASPEFRLCTQIRDEAHRFAITHHRKRRKLARQTPLLEKAPGVGPALRRRLTENFGSVEAIANLKAEELATLKGVTLDKAKRILAFLKSEL